MIRSALFALLACLLLAATACTSDPKPAPATGAGQQDPELVRLNQLLEKDPKNDSLLYKRAQIFYNAQGFDEALVDLANAINRDSLHHPEYYHLLADVLIDYARPNDSKRAIEVLQSAARIFPNRIPTLLKLSEFQLIVLHHTDALSTLDKVLRIDPQNAEGYFMAGRVALDMGDTSRAISVLQKSVQIDADNNDAWRFLGRIFAQKNNPVAIQYFDNALRIDSTDLATREFKAAFYKRRGEFDNAFATYRDIIIRNPDYSNAYFDIGTIYLELDSLQKAYDNYSLAITTDPLFIKAYYFRGQSSELMGNVEAALADYTQANKMSPNYEEPKAALERLKKK